MTSIVRYERYPKRPNGAKSSPKQFSEQSVMMRKDRKNRDLSDHERMLPGVLRLIIIDAIRTLMAMFPELLISASLF